MGAHRRGVPDVTAIGLLGPLGKKLCRVSGYFVETVGTGVVVRLTTLTAGLIVSIFIGAVKQNGAVALLRPANAVRHGCLSQRFAGLFEFPDRQQSEP